MALILKVTEAGSISAAAKNLYISQPSLSQTIKKMEDELGTPLFIRKSGKVVELTKAGKLYIKTARQILPLYHSFLNEIDSIQHYEKNHLRIGIPYHQGHLIINALLGQINTSLKHLDIVFTEGTSDELEDMLIEGSIDLAIIRLPLKIANLEYKVVYEEPLGMYLYQNHPCIHHAIHSPNQRYASLPLDALKDDVLALPPPDKRIRKTIDQIMKKHNFIPKTVKNYENKNSMISLVENGICCTIGKAPAVNTFSNTFFWIEHCTLHYDLAIVYLPDTIPNKDLLLIAKVLQNYCQENLT